MKLRFLSLTILVALSSITVAEEPAISRAETEAFLADLAADVERWHLKTDPTSEQRGTIYEFVVRPRLQGDKLPETDQGRWGQWVQAGGGDTYHSSAFYTAAMIQAFRVTGNERYKAIATEHQLPLFTRMLRNSDTLFPEQIPTVRAKLPFQIEHAMKGYLPFWWDDGACICISKEPITQIRPVVGSPPAAENPENRMYGYVRRISQHMAQTINVMMTEGWWLTKDPAIAEACEDFQVFYETCSPEKAQNWTKIPMVAGAAGYMTGQKKWLSRTIVWRSPVDAARGAKVQHLLGKYPRDRKIQIPSFLDNTHYQFYLDLMHHDGELSDENALFLVSEALTFPLPMEFWWDDGKHKPGMNRYDRAQGVLQFENGKPQFYHSELMIPFGSRVGPQHLVFCALALQALKARPDVWEALPKGEHPDDWIVPIHVSGSEHWSEAWSAASGDRLELQSGRTSLRLRGKSAGPELTIRIQQAERDDRPEASLILQSDGKLETKLHVAEKSIRKAGDGFEFELEVPYSAAKGQVEWINGIDHFRYEIRIGDEARTAYFLTPADEVETYLHSYLSAGLANWKAVFDEKGYIPGALHKPVAWGEGNDKREISHLYGYAFLTSACAQYLLYQDGKGYWDLLRP